MMFFIIFILLIICSLILIFMIGYNNEQYWLKRGVKFYSKNKVTGVFWNFFTKNVAMFQIFDDLYKEYRNEPALGIGALLTPALFVIHPKNIQHVLQSDFNSFYDRGMDVNEHDTLANNIVFMNGPKWKLVRQNMTPLFTATMLKNMYYIMDKSAQDFVVYLKNNPKTLKGGCFDTLMTFCNAAVCGAIFGITSESVFDSPFLNMAKLINEPTLVNNLKFSIMSMSRRLTKLLGISILKPYEDFFIHAVTKVIEEREKEGIKRHDFADVCVNIRKNGIMKDPSTGCELEPTFGLLSAQAMFFLIAGVEPVAIVIFATFVELGRHPEFLQKVQQEIDENFEKHNNIVTHEVISNMKFVNMVLSEAMRVNPPVGALIRECVQDSVLPVGNIKVQKGTKIFTPVYPIHHDPEYYSDPEVFNPDRFENVSKLSDKLYMPFGLGNRMCIGARYSKLQMAAGVVHILRHFTIKTKELGGPKFKKHFNNVRPTNVDVEFIPRNI